MDHSKHARLTEAELTPAILEGAAIYGPGDETIGTVDHVHGNGASAKVAIDVGGFLGIGSKRIAVAAKDLDFMWDEGGTVHALARWSEDEMKAMPEHSDR